jgi:NADH:ubiquinone oxidoreductase subunit D
VNIGTYSFQTCLDFGLTGVMARSCGIKRDLRLSKTETYANYYYLNFRSYTGQHGDSYDRFLIRMNEMSESLNIVNQSVNKISKFNNILNLGSKLNLNNINKFNSNSTILPHLVLNYLNKDKSNNRLLKSNYNSMENLINHFKF